LEQGTALTPEADGLTGVKQLPCSIKMILNFAGNPLNQHSDINHTIALLKNSDKCEFFLVSDVFMTATARFADILLPAASPLETENLALPWDAGAYILYNAKLTEPLFDSRFEFAFLEAVAQRLGLVEAWSEGRDHAGWLEHIYQEFRAEQELPDYETFKQAGGYVFTSLKTRIAYEEEVAGLRPFATPSGKIEIYSRRIHDLHLPAIPRYVPSPEGYDDPLRATYPLQLIGYHTKRRTHSIHESNPALESLDPQRLWIHPDDASARNIAAGDLALVFNQRGMARVPAFVTERIMRGVVALAQGAWYSPDQSGVDTRGSINVLTSQRPTPLARGNPQHTNLVEVRKDG
jgi:anaerobic dimethyl sulfoxide reductase subunit A